MYVDGPKIQEKNLEGQGKGKGEEEEDRGRNRKSVGANRQRGVLGKTG